MRWSSRRPKEAPAPAVPGDIEAERTLIGGLILYANDEVAPDFDVIRATLTADDFQGPTWRASFEAIAARVDAGEPVETELIVSDVRAALCPPADPADVGRDIRKARDDAPMVFSVPALAQRVGELGLRRRAIQAAGQLAAGFYDQTVPVGDVMAQINALYETLDRRIAARETGSTTEAHARLALRRADGYSTGLTHLDGWLGGLVSGRTTVVAGPTGTGKTWLIGTMALAAAADGARVALFTLEMTAEEMLVRLGANLGGAAAFRLLRPEHEWTDQDRTTYWELGKAIDALPLDVYERQRTPEEIAATVRSGRYDVAIVDYLQVMDFPADMETEYEQMRHAAKWCFRLGRRSGCHMVAVSQLNTASVRLGKDDPTAGLRGGGSTAEVADAIVRLSPGENATMTLTVVKNRWGPDRFRGAEVEYSMDRDTGRLIPTVDAPALVWGQGRRA